MPTSFPTAIDSLTNPLSSDTLDAVPHNSQHENANDAIEAIETVIGITGSADTNSLVYKIAALQSGKANVSHTHSISDVTGLQTALDGKAASSHTHAISDVTGLQTALDGKASLSHTHAISDVTGLQTALDGKASTSHAHSAADITSGTLGLSRGGTNASSFTASRLVYSDGSSLLSAAAVSYAASGTNLAVTAQNTTDIPLAAIGATSQTGNLAEFRVGSTIMARFNKDGALLVSAGASGGSVGPLANIQIGPQSIATSNALGAPFLKINNGMLICDGGGTFIVYNASGSGISGAGLKAESLSANNWKTADNARTVFQSTENSSNTFAVVGFQNVGLPTVCEMIIRNPSGQTGLITTLYRAIASQTGHFIEFQNSSSTALAAFRVDASWQPPSIADASASNNSVYYSTDAGKLVYRDSGGVVNALY